VRADQAKVVQVLRKINPLVTKHEEALNTRVVEEAFMRETIKHYMHDLEVILKHEIRQTVEMLKAELGT
jgi:cell wall assembly regulator SMI1